jgi:hypothetical protein
MKQDATSLLNTFIHLYALYRDIKKHTETHNNGHDYTQWKVCGSSDLKVQNDGPD